MAAINSTHHKHIEMTKLFLLAMAFVFGIRTAKSILIDFKEDTLKYIMTISIAFYASWKDWFANIVLGMGNILADMGLDISFPTFDDGQIIYSLIKALINLISSGVFVPITTLYVTYRFKKWLNKKKK